MQIMLFRDLNANKVFLRDVESSFTIQQLWRIDNALDIVLLISCFGHHFFLHKFTLIVIYILFK